MSKHVPPPTPAARPPLAEVRYSIVGLLEEIKLERAASAFAMERLDQHEIKKLFKTKRRGSRTK